MNEDFITLVVYGLLLYIGFASGRIVARFIHRLYFRRWLRKQAEELDGKERRNPWD